MRDMTVSSEAMFSDVCVILNAKSGRQRAELRERLVGAFSQSGLHAVFRQPAKGEDIAAVARDAVDEGFGVIVAAGGDGTQSAVANALSGTEVLMGIVPTGTFNFFAREHGISPDLPDAVATIRDGRVKEVSVGEINGDIFLNNASFGLYPAVLREREGIYRRWGRSRIAAYWSVVSALIQMYRPMVLDVDADGTRRRFETALAFVGNSAYQLRTYELEGAEAVGEDRFALLIARATTPAGLLLSALRLAWRTAQRGVDFDLICAERIVIETRPNRRLVARDGEKKRMTGPFTLTVRPRALKIIVPEAGPETS